MNLYVRVPNEDWLGKGAETTFVHRYSIDDRQVPVLRDGAIFWQASDGSHRQIAENHWIEWWTTEVLDK